MAQALDTTALAGLTGPGGAASLARPGEAASAGRETACHHCGEPCARGIFEADRHPFCCVGCQTVFLLLKESGLEDYYRLNERPGVRVAQPVPQGKWAFLDTPEIRRRLLDFEDDRVARVTFQVPAIHCVACVWLLENLFRLHPGIGRSRVHFTRREVAIAFAPDRVRLGEVAELLERLGYEPALTLAELDRRVPARPRRLGLQIGIAGFAFGNIMLFSLPSYLGLEAGNGPGLRALFGILSLILALPAVLYSASDYWRSAWASLRQRMLTLDVPIAAGLAALYLQSLWEIVGGRGEGYLDSLSGLIFFLLCGRAFQQRTQDRLGFDRDYRAFFPLAALRRTATGEETVSISSLEVGDRIVVRHGELIPADCRLVSGEALVDYSFVTGESEPVTRRAGEHLFAGGRQTAGAIELETVKPVSESYLTSLWNDEAFRKPRDRTFETLTNRYSRRFTVCVVGIALAAAVSWAVGGQAGRGIKAFTSVLIVACPCALALVAPFTLGTVHRLLSRHGVFLRNAQVIETLAEVDTIAFDKTGTLTAAGKAAFAFRGMTLDAPERAAIAAVCRQSVHPYARQIAAEWRDGREACDRAVGGNAGQDPASGTEVQAFREESGLGMSGTAGGRRVVLGSRDWLRRQSIDAPDTAGDSGSAVWLALDGGYRGTFELENRLRPAVGGLLADLGTRYGLALLSGDRPRERERFEGLFGAGARLHFNQSPHAKLAFVRALQDAGGTVMMVGDGLNDAGALRQGDVGVAVVEGVGRFTPASDVILDAAMMPRLGAVLRCSRLTTKAVRAGFVLSALYNGVGVSIAAAGVLSPVICAILMPLSSATIVLFAVGASHWAARKTGLTADPGGFNAATGKDA